MFYTRYKLHDIKAIIRSCDRFSCNSEYYLTMLDNTNLEGKEFFRFIFINVKQFFVDICISRKNDSLLMNIQKLLAIKRYGKYVKYFKKKFKQNITNITVFELCALELSKKHRQYKKYAQHEFSKQQKIKLLKQTSLLEDIVTHHISKYL